MGGGWWAYRCPPVGAGGWVDRPLAGQPLEQLGHHRRRNAVARRDLARAPVGPRRRRAQVLDRQEPIVGAPRQLDQRTLTYPTCIVVYYVAPKALSSAHSHDPRRAFQDSRRMPKWLAPGGDTSPG